LVSHGEFIENYQGNNLSTIVGLYWDGYVSDYTEQKLKSEYTSINKLIQSFDNIEKITDIIILGKDGGVRRIEIG
jgi:hypothetical protein